MELEVLGLPETLAQEETQTEQPVEEEEHNPILPEADELIFGSLAFLLVFVVLARYAFPRLNQGLRQREEKIRGDLEGAEEARKEAEASLQRYEQQLQEARAESGRIIEEARKTADSMRRDLLAKAEEESRAVVARAQEEIRAERDRVIQELRGQLAEWSVDLAGRVVGASLDKRRHLKLVEEYIDEVAGMGDGEPRRTKQRRKTEGGS
ncbi:MAG: F0F1 ATP synthase subunit B [Actinomycetota bacterium]